MRNGIVITRGEEFLSRAGKGVRVDECGMCWSKDIQKARVYQNSDTALRTAARVGGLYRIMKDGRVMK